MIAPDGYVSSAAAKKRVECLEIEKDVVNDDVGKTKEKRTQSLAMMRYRGKRKISCFRVVEPSTVKNKSLQKNNSNRHIFFLINTFFMNNVCSGVFCF